MGKDKHKGFVSKEKQIVFDTKVIDKEMKDMFTNVKRKK